MRQLENHTFQEAKEIVQKFIAAVRSGSDEHIHDKSLAVLVALKKYDGREDCILLTWKALLNYMENQ